MVYYTMIASAIWFLVLAYCWHVSFKKLQMGSVDDKLKGKIAYFHIAAWSVPLVAAIIAMATKSVSLLV